MIDAKPRYSCRGLRGPACDCLFPLTNFIVNKQEKFQTFLLVNSISTRHKYHPHGPVATPACFQKSMYCADIKMFSSLCVKFHLRHVYKY